MKKPYLKPETEQVEFYSEEEVANSVAEDESISGDMETVDLKDLGFQWS